METAFELVSEFGIAVALCIAFVWMFYQVFKWQREDGLNREARDRETISKLSEIVNVNSQALLQNSQTMEKINGNIEGIALDVKDLQQDINEIKIRQQAFNSR